MSRPRSALHSAPDQLLRKLGVEVDEGLLNQALTHRSFAYENGGIPHNERLEFLGDSVLGQAVTVMLYTEHPGLPEGELAKRRASLVSAVALAEVARSLDLGSYLRLGRGEELTGGRAKASILADTVEALIGASFLSAGAEPTTRMVLRLIEPLRGDPSRFGDALDPKTSLQELAARLGMSAPEYRVSAQGPDHARIFRAEIFFDGADAPISAGEGASKKRAELSAALVACELLQAQ